MRHRLIAGALFQLYNGTTTLDIGTVGGVVNMTTWSAFCGGVAATCKVAKIYAQIQGHGNDLIAATFNAPFGPNCSTGGTYQCAAPFTIEQTTGLPILTTVAPYEYALASDAAATGVNALGANESIIYNGRGITVAYCCGSFGTTHLYSAADTPGTDFMLQLNYGTAGGFTEVNCSTSATYCMGAEIETDGNVADYGSSIINVIAAVTYNSTSNRINGMLNGHSIVSNATPGATMNSGQRIHLGGGGDLSQPAPVLMREALITNTALTTAQINSATANMTQFYGCLSFP